MQRNRVPRLCALRAMPETPPSAYKEFRRSTRVAIRVRIDVHGTGMSCDGETIVVNLHGALVRMSSQIEVGSRVTVHVHLTGKSAGAQVIFASPEQPLEFGIGLDHPQNIWGISLSPAD